MTFDVGRQVGPASSSGFHVGRYLGPIPGGVAPALVLSVGNMGLTFDANGGTLINTVAAGKTVTDWEAVTRTALANEIRYEDARRVENFISSPYTSWFVTGTASPADNGDGTYTISGLTGAGDYIRNTALVASLDGNSYRYSVELKAQGADIGKQARIYYKRVGGGSFVQKFIDVVLTGSFQYFTAPQFDGTASQLNLEVRVGGAATDPAGSVDARVAQLEEVTSQSNKNPSSPVHRTNINNSGIALVKYYNFNNGNTVDGNGLVTESSGALFATKPLMLSDGDQVSIPVVSGINFNQDKGCALLNLKPDYAASSQTTEEDLVTIDGSVFNLIISGVSAAGTFDGTNIPAVAASWLAGDDVAISVVYSDDENKLTISVSKDGGATWATWVESPYDSAFGIATVYNFFKALSFKVNMCSFRMYEDFGGRNVAGMQEWVEDNAEGFNCVSAQLP